MARDEAYQEAERRIEAARLEGATELDLSRMDLTEAPEAIAHTIEEFFHGTLYQGSKIILVIAHTIEEFLNGTLYQGSKIILVNCFSRRIGISR